MRSSESANITITSTWLPNVMRSGNTKKAVTASSHGSASAQPKRWRSSRYSAARLRAISWAAWTVVLLAAIETCRLDEEDGNSHRVNEKSSGVGKQIFASGVEDAEHQCSKECAL